MTWNVEPWVCVLSSTDTKPHACVVVHVGFSYWQVIPLNFAGYPLSLSSHTVETLRNWKLMESPLKSGDANSNKTQAKVLDVIEGTRSKRCEVRETTKNNKNLLRYSSEPICLLSKICIRLSIVSFLEQWSVFSNTDYCSRKETQKDLSHETGHKIILSML